MSSTCFLLIWGKLVFTVRGRADGGTARTTCGSLSPGETSPQWSWSSAAGWLHCLLLLCSKHFASWPEKTWKSLEQLPWASACCLSPASIDWPGRQSYKRLGVHGMLQCWLHLENPWVHGKWWKAPGFANLGPRAHAAPLQGAPRHTRSWPPQWTFCLSAGSEGQLAPLRMDKQETVCKQATLKSTPQLSHPREESMHCKTQENAFPPSPLQNSRGKSVSLGSCERESRNCTM